MDGPCSLCQIIFLVPFFSVRHRDSRIENGNFNKNNDKFPRYFVGSFRKYGQLDIGEGKGGRSGALRNEKHGVLLGTAHRRSFLLLAIF